MTIKTGPKMGLLIGAAPGEAHFAQLCRFLRGVDGFLGSVRVLSRVASLPGTVVDGAMYLVTSGANANQIARYSIDAQSFSGWEYFAPFDGLTIWSTEDQKRYRYRSSSSAWIEETTDLPSDVYRKSNILAAVSQVGGVPTGGIIEYGSNASGEYIRFAGGLQICVVRFTGYVANTLKNLPMPAAFAAGGPSYQAISGGVTPADGYDYDWTAYAERNNIGFMSKNTFAQNIVTLLAIGRWYV